MQSDNNKILNLIKKNFIHSRQMQEPFYLAQEPEVMQGRHLIGISLFLSIKKESNFPIIIQSLIRCSSSGGILT
jgi:hypothetical protein